MIRYLSTLTAVLAMLSMSAVLAACGAAGPLALLDMAGEASDRTLDAAASTVDRYCATPRLARQKLRDAVNMRSERGDIHIHCLGDDALSLRDLPDARLTEAEGGGDVSGGLAATQGVGYVAVAFDESGGVSLFMFSLEPGPDGFDWRAGAARGGVDGGVLRHASGHVLADQAGNGL